MENIRDWCVSRQLWWGHRIPAYYVLLEGELFFGEVRRLLAVAHTAALPTRMGTALTTCCFRA